MADFNWGSLIGTGVNAVSNWYAGNQANQAGQTAMQYADPYGAYRPAAAQRLESLQANPNQVTSLPGYQFGMDQGRQTLERSAAAKGYLGSGNILAELQKYGQGYAGQQFDKERDFQARLSGAYNNPATAAQFGYTGAMNQANANNEALGTLTSGIFGGNNGIASQGVTAGKNYLSDLYNQYTGGGTQSPAPVTDLSVSSGGSSGGGMPSTPPSGTGNYLSSLSGFTPNSGGVAGMNTLGTTSDPALIEAFTGPGYETSAAGVGASTSAADGATAYNALASTAEGAEGAAAAGGGSTGASMAGLGYFGGAAALMYASMLADEKRSAERKQNQISHGQSIAGELSARGFDPNSIDFNQAYLNPGNFDYSKIAQGGGIENVNNNYLQSKLGGYDPTAISNYLGYGLSPDLLSKSTAASNASFQAIKSDPRYTQSIASNLGYQNPSQNVLAALNTISGPASGLSMADPRQRLASTPGIELPYGFPQYYQERGE